MSGRTLLVLLAAVALVVLSMPLWLEPASRGPLLDVRAPEGLAGFAELLRNWGADVEPVDVAPDGPVPLEAAAIESPSVETPDAETSESEDTAPSSAEQVRRAWSEALGRLPADVSLVLAFPATMGVATRLESLGAELRDGRTVLVLYSGLPLAFEESAFLADLGVGLRDLDKRSRLAPWSWWRDRRQGHAHRLHGVGVGAGPSVSTGLEAWSDPMRAIVDPAADCEQLAEFLGPRSKDLRPEGRALSVARCPVGEGRLLLAPTSMLANARLRGDGNLHVAAALAAELGNQVRFLEARSTVRSAALDARAGDARRTLNLVAGQLALLYLVALLALARGFGPRWPPLNQPADAQRGFLLSVGALHRRIGDFGLAARTLRERWLEYDPLARRRSEETGEGVPEVPVEPQSESELVDWAVRHSRGRRLHGEPNESSHRSIPVHRAQP